MNSHSENNFDASIKKEVASNIDKIRPSYDKNRLKFQFVIDQRILISNEITDTYNSDLALNDAFHDIQKELIADINLSYEEAIKLSSAKKNVDEKAL